MKEILALLSDEIVSKLKVLSKEMYVPEDNIIEDSLREYLSKLDKIQEKVITTHQLSFHIIFWNILLLDPPSG